MPSIAVLAFDNLSGDPEQEYFSDGITEDIITALSRIRQFFIIARNTTFTYKGQAVDVQTIAKDLGVRFVLEGSVRKAGERIRITAQLIDGVTGNHLWAEKYDRNLEDIFAVQDEITQTVVGAIEPEMAKAERDRAIIQRPDSLGAWELYQRGTAHLWDQGEHGQPQELEEALNNFNESASLDPRFSLAYTGIAWCHCYEVLFGLTEDRQRTLELGFAAVKKAVELDQQDPHAYMIWAAFHFLNREPEEAIRISETAIKINPSFGTVRYYLGMSLIAIGAASDGVKQMDLARKISPGDIAMGPGMAWTAIGYLVQGEFKEAVGWARKSLDLPTTQIWGNVALVSALGHLGNQGEMEPATKELLRRRPDFTVSFARMNFPGTDPDGTAMLIEGLIKAGVPEG